MNNLKLMEVPTRKVVVFIAMSLDGFIAKDNDNLDFLSIVEKEGEDYGYHRFIETVDTIVIGRRTFDWLVERDALIHKNKQVIIITSRPETIHKDIPTYSGDLVNLMVELKSTPGKNIYCEGGAKIIDQLLKNDLIDELTISIIPVLLGNGLRLFKRGLPLQKLELQQAIHFDTGLCQLNYIRKN